MSSDALYFEVEERPWRRVPDGEYQARIVKYSAQKMAMFRGEARLYVHFEIVGPGNECGVRLFGSWRLNAIREAGGKTRVRVAPSSELYRMVSRLLGHTIRGDRFSLHPLLGCVLRIRTETVKRDRRQREHPEHMQYSVVRDIVMIEAGSA